MLLIAAVLVLFDVIEGGKTIQGFMSLPEAFWELSIGVYLIVKGCKPSAITEYMDSLRLRRQMLEPSAHEPRAPRG